VKIGNFFRSITIDKLILGTIRPWQNLISSVVSDVRPPRSVFVKKTEAYTPSITEPPEVHLAIVLDLRESDTNSYLQTKIKQLNMIPYRANFLAFYQCI